MADVPALVWDDLPHGGAGGASEECDREHLEELAGE
jgi:hypothetical protein